MIAFIWHCGKDQTTEMENRSILARDKGWVESLTTKGQHEESFLE